MKKIVIIGGGASGVIAALNINSKDSEILILEKNNDILKKLLATGNGRCNFYNEDMNIKHFHTSSKVDISKYINNTNEVLEQINNIGVIPKIKNGYYYPFSNKSETIKNALQNELDRKKIKIYKNYKVETIEKNNNKFIINNEIECDIVIVSTGGMAAPKTGSTGDGYNILKKFGHSIIKPLPSLVKLMSNNSYLDVWNGVREDGKVSLYINDELVKTEEGEIQFTNYGISGICIFNLSRLASISLNENKKVDIHIDFMPFIKKDTILFLKNIDKNYTIYDLLSRIINEKLAKVIIDSSNIKRNVLFKNLSNKELAKLTDNIRNYKVHITKTKDFNDSQVTIGGVNLTEVDSNTFESLKVKNLYIIGEVLDLDADCGGYNLTIAFLSAIKAARGINND